MVRFLGMIPDVTRVFPPSKHEDRHDRFIVYKKLLKISVQKGQCVYLMNFGDEEDKASYFEIVFSGLLETGSSTFPLGLNSSW